MAKKTPPMATATWKSILESLEYQLEIAIEDGNMTRAEELRLLIPGAREHVRLGDGFPVSSSAHVYPRKPVRTPR
jgi:hypothetical protein